MPRFMSLGFAAIACLANAMQVPGSWDLFDIGSAVMAGCSLVVAIWGD